MTAYIVAGTQAQPGKQNHVIVMKMSQLDKTLQNDEESEWNETSIDCSKFQIWLFPVKLCFWWLIKIC